MKRIWRLVALVLVAGIGLQLFFLVRIALAATVDPQSTTFQRSEAWRLATGDKPFRWRQQWVPYGRISDNLKRAVIASEDDRFASHEGVDWEALEKAWERNAQAEARAARQQSRASTRSQLAPPRRPKIVGGSTITQQLAKNLLLSGERTVLRKGQEALLTLLLEGLLDKQRILEIYLNNVEWGEGVFGAQAAARHYFRVDAARLGPAQAARLAVMLPAPKRFEKRPASPYVVGRAATIQARMGAVEPP